jgi:ABC-type nitrate/sulfonate/bicarbonate transport system substrate-binding protein
MKRNFLSIPVAGAVMALSSVTVLSAGSVASASTLTSVKFVYDFPGPDMELIPVVVAQREGFFKKSGLKISVEFPPSTSSTTQLLTTGSGDIGFITTSDMAVAVEAKAPILSVANYSMTNNWGLFAKPGSTLTLASLKGKKIFSWGDTWTNAMIPFVLKKANLKSSDITIVTGANDTPLLMNGTINFTTSTTNYAIPGITEAAKSAPVGIVGSAAGVPNVPVWVYAVTHKYANQHGANVKKFLTALQAATIWASAHRAKAVADFITAYPKSGYSKFYSTKGWNLTVPLLTNKAGKYFVQTNAQWTTLATALKGVNLIKSIPAPSTYYTNKFIP